MKTYIVTRGIYLFIAAFSFIALSGCDSNNSEDDPPEVIPGEVFSLPVDLFNQSASKAQPPGVNFTAAALRVWPVSLVISANLIIPSLTTVQALNEEPVFNDGLWEWSSSIVSGSQNIQFALTADRISGGTNWSMKITTTDPISGQDFDNFELFTGRTANNGESGSWQLFLPVNDSTENVLNATYEYQNASEKSILFSIPETATFAAGDSVDYVENGDERQFIWRQVAEDIIHTVVWDAVTLEGSIIATNFNGGTAGCWDTTLEDADCTPS